METILPFLVKAKKNCWAAGVIPVSSTRKNSKDLHFAEGEFKYLDSYFGSERFLGQEVVWMGKQEIWGMNYYGFTVSNEISEGLFDAILRPALMSGSGDNIPVRGPKEFVNGEWKYTFNTDGDLANFTGIEEISKNGKVVCRLHCHGGFIE